MVVLGHVRGSWVAVRTATLLLLDRNPWQLARWVVATVVATLGRLRPTVFLVDGKG